MKRIFFLVLGMFSVGSSSFMIAGLLPKISETIGQPISVASQGITAFGLTYLIAAPLFSVLFANKPAKPTLQIALMVFLIGNAVTLSAQGIWTFLIGRVLTAVGAGIFNPLCAGLAIQLGNPHAKGKSLSLVAGANSAGVVFGVPLAVFLSSKWGWQISIAYVSVLSLLALVGFSFQKIDIHLPAASSIKDRFGLLVDKKVLSILTVTCFASLASLGLYSYISLIQAGSADSLVVALFCWGLGGFIGSSLVGHFVDRMKKSKFVMKLILTGLMLAILTIPFTIEYPTLKLFCFFLWGAFGWATTTPQQHMLFELYEKHRPILSALNSSALGLGSAFGTALGGFVLASGLKPLYLPFFSASVLMAVLIKEFAHE